MHHFQMQFYSLLSSLTKQEYALQNEAAALFKSVFPYMVKQIIVQLNNC